MIVTIFFFSSLLNPEFLSIKSYSWVMLQPFTIRIFRYNVDFVHGCLQEATSEMLTSEKYIKMG
jgi:hypothetical protein